MTDRQSQKAGDGSVQVQFAGGVNIHIDGERAIQILESVASQSLFDGLTESNQVADRRLRALVQRMTPRLLDSEIQAGLGDPGFIDTLRRAFSAATLTDEESDYDVITELIALRSTNNPKSFRTILNRATEIVPQIDADALQGITFAWFMTLSAPDPDPEIGLGRLDDLAGRLLSLGDPPATPRWIRDADVLDCVRHESLGNNLRWVEAMAINNDAYVAEGFSQAERADVERLLGVGGLPPTLIVEHQLHPGYFRLNLRHSKDLRELWLRSSQADPNEQALHALEMESHLRSISSAARRQLDQAASDLPNLSTVRSWWNSMRDSPYSQTPIGVALALSNARRVDTLGDLGDLRDHLDHLFDEDPRTARTISH